jgi:hypothetical protein
MHASAQDDCLLLAAYTNMPQEIGNNSANTPGSCRVRFTDMVHKYFHNISVTKGNAVLVALLSGEVKRVKPALLKAVKAYKGVRS